MARTKTNENSHPTQASTLPPKKHGRPSTKEAAAKKALAAAAFNRAAAAFNRAAEHLAGGSNEPAPGEGGDDEMAKIKGMLAITTRVMYLPDHQPNLRL